MRLAVVMLASWMMIALCAGESVAATYEIDPAHSDVAFRIRHLVAYTTGRFNEFRGEITFDASHIEASRVEVEIQASSIDTKHADRDQHLRSADFFDVEQFPILTFVSNQVTPTDGARGTVTGEFTMLGVTREIVLQYEFLGEVEDSWGNIKAGFTLSGELDRTHYGMIWNKALDQGGFILGKTVSITIEIEAQKVVPEGA